MLSPGFPSYTPTCEYTGGTVVVPKSSLPNGTVTMFYRYTQNVANAAMTMTGVAASFDDGGYRSNWGCDISAERACAEAAYTNVLWNSEYNAYADEYEETLEFC